MNRARAAAWLEALLLAAVLLLAAYLRLVNSADNPGWFNDEGTHLDIAQHLLQGRVQYLAVQDSVLLFARMPLFEAALAALLGLFGGGMTTLRLFTGLLGVLTVALLYGFARRAGGKRLGLLAALLLAVYPQAVIYSRFGFSYNLLGPLALLMLPGLRAYLRNGQRRWLAVAALAAGIGVLSDLVMGALAVPLLLGIAAKRWRDLGWCLPLLALPGALYVLVMLLNVPDAFWFDLGFTFSRLGSVSLLEQGGNVAYNYAALLTLDPWFFAGVLGLFLLRPARLRLLALIAFFVPLVLMGRTAALYQLGFYYLIPLLPLLMLGAAALLDRSAAQIWTTIHDSLPALAGRGRAVIAALATGSLIGTPLVVSLLFTLRGVNDGFITNIEPFLVRGEDARAAAAFVNAQAAADDVVIASPTVAWLVEAQAADFLMAAAAEGEATPYLPGDIPAARFAFDPTFAGTRFVIVDDLWRNWGSVHSPAAYAMLVALADWPLVYRAGTVEVYANPGE